MALRDGMRRWLGITDASREGELAPYRNCELAGHHYEPRFDEKPLFLPTPDDVIKFQGAKAISVKKNSGGYTMWDEHVTPKVDVTAQLQLVEASKERNYLGDCCRYCGRFIRYEREP